MFWKWKDIFFQVCVYKKYLDKILYTIHVFNKKLISCKNKKVDEKIKKIIERKKYWFNANSFKYKKFFTQYKE